MALADLLYCFNFTSRPCAGPYCGGSGLTIVILVGIVTYLLLNFNTFFTQFHEVFFESSTWTFLWSDSLIRLFPLKFWEDAFTFVGGGALEALPLAAWAWWGLK